jgi:hypothetical protein
MEKRLEQRHKLVVPMKVFGMDAMGKPFIETARAVNISPGGLHLSGLKAINRVGEVIGVQYNETKIRATVVWVGYPDSTLDGHIGLQVVGHDTRLWQAVQPALKTHAPDEAEVSVQKFGGGPDRRRAKRYACRGSVKLVIRGVGHPVWATVTDLSAVGCYVETAAPAPVTTQIEMVINVEGCIVAAQAEVRGSYPGVGMGVTFTEIKEQDRQELAKLVAKLAARQGIYIPG